jgi:hypothetical protein
MKELKDVLGPDDFRYVCELDDLMRDEVWERRIRLVARKLLHTFSVAGAGVAGFALPEQMSREVFEKQQER